ncbi:MAG: MotA/TolQ/ExbB proton channel family protein [Elusimicrobiota bacterium]
MNRVILDFVISGGPVMIPIIICCLVVWFLIVEKHFLLKKESRDSAKFTEDVIRLLAAKKIEEVKSLCLSKQNAVSDTFLELLSSERENRDTYLATAEQIFHEKYPKLEKGVATISVLATIEPLLSLLGTVTGMVATFTTITLHGAGNPQLLAKGISEALITTASGLMVSIPAMYFHNSISKKIDDIMNDLEKSSMKLINFLTLKSTNE